MMDEKSQFLTSKALYSGNDAKWDQNETLIATFPYAMLKNLVEFENDVENQIWRSVVMKMRDKAPRRVGMWGWGVPIPTESGVRERLCIFNIKMVSFVRSGQFCLSVIHAVSRYCNYSKSLVCFVHAQRCRNTYQAVTCRYCVQTAKQIDEIFPPPGRSIILYLRFLYL